MESTKILLLGLIISPVFVFADGNLTVITGDLSTLSTSGTNISTISGAVNTGSTSTGAVIVSTGTIATGSTSTGNVLSGNVASGFSDNGISQFVSAQTKLIISNIIDKIDEMDQVETDYEEQRAALLSGFFEKYPSNNTGWERNFKKSYDEKALNTVIFKQKKVSKTAYINIAKFYRLGTGDAKNLFCDMLINGMSQYYSGLKNFVDPATMDKFNIYVADNIELNKNLASLELDYFNKRIAYEDFVKNQIASLGQLSPKRIDKLNLILGKWTPQRLDSLMSTIDTKISAIAKSDMSSELKDKKIAYWISIEFIADLKLGDSIIATSFEKFVAKNY